MTNREKLLAQFNEYTNVELARMFAHYVEVYGCGYCPLYNEAEDCLAETEDSCFKGIRRWLEEK